MSQCYQLVAHEEIIQILQTVLTILNTYTCSLKFFFCEKLVNYNDFVLCIGFVEVGGFQELYYKYMEAIPRIPDYSSGNGTLADNTTLYTYINTTCGRPRDDSWVMLRNPVNSDMPWPAFLFGQTPASIWYWCTDQVSDNHEYS